MDVNIAILGVGNMGKKHFKAALESPLVKNVIGYEPDREKAQALIKSGMNITSDLENILNNSEISIVTIAAPNEYHCELACRAMEAGKAVLCEKPMGLSLAECKRMLNTKNRMNAFLQIGFELHYSKLYLKAKEWIDTGRIGRILNVHCDYIVGEFHGKNSWRNTKGGTLIGEKLSHYLDLPRWWVNDEVEEVYSLVSPNFIPYFAHPDNHTIMYRFRNGTVSSLFFVMGVAESVTKDPLELETLRKDLEAGGVYDKGNQLRFLICGSKGAIETSVYDRRIRCYEYSMSENGHENKKVEDFNYPYAEGTAWHHNVHDEVKRIIELVANGKKPDTTPEDSYETMKLVFAAEQSYTEKKPIILNSNN